ncbi:MAG: PilZ domain-containing protein [Desulfobulbus sp.]|nr:PilZ domain-containing protein [Desulfobulbus sp.]
MKNETFVFFGEYTGTLIDISEGGLAVQCAVLEEDPVFPALVDIFVAKPNFHHLPDFPFSLVGAAQAVPDSIFNRSMAKRFSIQFGLLTHGQLTQLEHFIANNAVLGN